MQERRTTARPPTRLAGLCAIEERGGVRRLHVADRTLVLCRIHYDRSSAGRNGPLYTPVENADLDAFFESSVIARLLERGIQRGTDYLGVLSWKFRAKIPLGPREILDRMRADGFDAEVYSFFGRIRSRRPWELAEEKHPGILRAATLLMKRLDVRVDLERLEAPVIHQNHFVARSRTYARFGREMLRPALAAMSDPTDRGLTRLLRRPAGYEDPRFGADRLRALFGRPYFCLHPFLAERLFSTWLGLHPRVRVRHVWRGRFVERSVVAHEPEMRPVGTRASA